MGGDSSNAGMAADGAGRLSQISSRTNQMAIDAILRVIPRGPDGWANAALEAQVVARRMAQVTADFEATIRQDQG
ncbi:hypothetical protein [Indioceanicola profundi]|uniref:hypothetical protein n=1 Tax=Indioceanicola profundi TaxID=2220096 RepID=UPI000E6ABC67|nr:hypothetical protein [Indioceanicola profundi]